MIETDRLLLRHWREDDRQPWRAMNADPQVMAHFPKPLDAAEADRQMDWCQSRLADGGTAFWAVERKADAVFLGFVGLGQIGHDIPIKGRWEIGWRLARHAWGQGYATEAARASLEHGFGALALSDILSYTAATNLLSMAVMERIGMTRTPALDFDHPAIPEGHRLRRHLVWLVRP